MLTTPIAWAKSLMTMDDPDWVILDTETTGLDGNAEIIEIAIITREGEILLNELIKPWQPIPPEATRIHGISYEAVATRPSFVKVMPRLGDVLRRHKRIITYNADFDRRMLLQTAEKSHIQLFMSTRAAELAAVSTAPIKYVLPLEWQCLMKQYAQFWSGGSRPNWIRLEEACKQQGLLDGAQEHRALFDARAALALLKAMAAKEESED